MDIETLEKAEKMQAIKESLEEKLKLLNKAVKTDNLDTGIAVWADANWHVYIDRGAALHKDYGENQIPEELKEALNVMRHAVDMATQVLHSALSIALDRVNSEFEKL